MLMEAFVRQGSQRLHLRAWEQRFPGLSAGITTCEAGNMAFGRGEREEEVQDNRHLLAAELSMEEAHWVFAEQVHQIRVQRVQRSTPSPVPRCDGLSTDEPQVVLALLFADCVPLYFVRPAQPYVIALAHAGWRGTVQNMVSSVFSHLCAEWGGSPADWHVAIGPSIGACCYAVDEPVITAVQGLLDEDWQKVAHPLPPQDGQPQWSLDLKQVNLLLLLRHGVPREQILLSTYCTHCSGPLFYSHRRQKEAAGRMLAWMGVGKA